MVLPSSKSVFFFVLFCNAGGCLLSVESWYFICVYNLLIVARLARGIICRIFHSHDQKCLAASANGFTFTIARCGILEVTLIHIPTIRQLNVQLFHEERRTRFNILVTVNVDSCHLLVFLMTE